FFCGGGFFFFFVGGFIFWVWLLFFFNMIYFRVLCFNFVFPFFFFVILLPGGFCGAVVFWLGLSILPGYFGDFLLGLANFQLVFKVLL
ncbi:hypothetical protein, partial [Salmonella enterica]|uniref:hypothetical protein n=1 Tax=Salmonella enterica TaxID=28901 RepID=UPI0020C2120C